MWKLEAYYKTRKEAEDAGEYISEHVFSYFSSVLAGKEPMSASKYKISKVI
jgi:hypothetical protein